ncbi:MAG TPA: O-methyltransferase [Thermoanaerobaculia bacterium]|jgi:predicted O-methyltransferase YrrM
MSTSEPNREVEEIELVTESGTAYMHGLLPPRSPELLRMEQYARENRFPIIGPLAGQFCYQLARIMGARSIFEMGSGYGYSTAWFARAVQENGGGRVHHVVWNEGLSRRARKHLARMGLGELVEYRVSEAVAALKETDGVFDIIFCDIVKEQYPEALPVIAEKLRPGGVLIADNAWWFGRVVHETDQSPPTVGMRIFTQQLVKDPRWIVTFVPMRDGLLVAYRNGQEPEPQ